MASLRILVSKCRAKISDVGYLFDEIPQYGLFRLISQTPQSLCVLFISTIRCLTK